MATRSKAEGSRVQKGRKRSSEVHATQDRKISDIFPARRSKGGPQAPAKKGKRSKKAEAEPQRKLQSAVPKTLRTEPPNARPPKTPGKGASKRPAFKAAPNPAARRYLEEAEFEEITYRVGDSAYIIMEPGEYGSEEEYEACEVCERAKKTVGRREIPLLECDRCLRGYHLTCLDPPLPHVPKETWLCPKCAAGAPLPPPRAEPRTAREKLIAGTLGLVRIVAIWREPDDSLWFTGRWYILPEEAHTGRQKHHGAREVFLTQQVDNNEMELLLRVARVTSPARIQDFDAENDIFVCEYEYDTAWQRFRRLAEEELEEEPDADWAASDADDESDDESHDGTFKPIYAFWAERGMVPARKMRGGGRRRPQAQPAAANAGRRHRVQGGDQWKLVSKDGILGLGASQIPETARIFHGSELCRARSVLALTAAPSSLPCREAERETIACFVREAVEAGPDCLGRCLYVSGVPGTGKTATVLEVMRTFRSPAGGLAPFQFVEINSLRLPTPQHAYTHLYEALTGQYLKPGTALTHLEELFGGGGGGQTARKRGVTVVLIDEMDLLMTRNQQVLYNLFEWPTRAGSRLAMIGVANTMDLPERLLPRIASRLGGRRTVFQPYSRPQLATIVDARLSEAGLSHTFAHNAINMACSKVAGVSGDVRRVLQLCRKASEVCEERKCSQVAMEHVNQAVEEMFSAAHMQLLANCCRLEKMVLACLLLELRARGRADAVLEEIVFRLQQLAEVRGEAPVGFGDCLAACHRLAARRLLLTECQAKRLRMQLSLNVPHDDVVDVLHSDASIPWLKDLHL